MKKIKSYLLINLKNLIIMKIQLKKTLNIIYIILIKKYQKLFLKVKKKLMKLKKIL